MISSIKRGPRSRAGLKEACDSPAIIMISSPTVAPTISGKNQAAGALALRFSSSEKTTKISTAVPSTSPSKPSQIGTRCVPAAPVPNTPG